MGRVGLVGYSILRRIYGGLGEMGKLLVCRPRVV